MKDRFEIINKEILQRDFSSQAEYYKEYSLHISFPCGASGMYDLKTKKGTIWSHFKVVKQLRLNRYKDLRFCNGGDDDVLVIDHQRKEYAFFEDNAPSMERLIERSNLKSFMNESY